MRNDALYMIVPYGIGDAIILCGLKNSIEAQYGMKVIPVIKPSHEIVVRVYGITDYQIMVLGEKELHRISKKNPTPVPGEYFVAHPAFANKQLDNAFLNHEIGFVDMFCRHLGIEEGLKIDKLLFDPKDVAAINEDELQGKIGISDYKKVLLVAPELKSASEAERVQDEWFERIIKDYENRGYKVIVNADAHRNYYEKQVVDLSLDELAYLGTRVGKIIAARSGFCDLVYGYASDMEIFYPNKAFYDLFNMKQIFANVNTKVSENIVSISEQLTKRGIKNVAIYGYGNVGRRIRYSLEKEKFPIRYLIDKQRIEDGVLPYYRCDDALPMVDAVLITISDGVDDVFSILAAKGLKAIRLADVMRLL